MIVRADDDRWVVDQDDCISWLTRYNNASVDLVVTDPAYEALEKHRVKPNGKPRGTTVRLSESDGSSNKWFPIFKNDRLPELFRQLYRVLKKHSHCYMMSAADHDQICAMVDAGRSAGFTFWKAIPWDKMRVGMGYHWRASHEMILFFEKGKRRLNFLGWPDVIQVRSHSPQGVTGAMLQKALEEYDKILWDKMQAGEKVHSADREAMHAALESLVDVTKDVPTKINVSSLRGDGLYPTEKPVPLWDKLIANSSQPGELVVDPFMGSGSSGVSALGLGRLYHGCDVQEAAVKEAVFRLGEITP